MQKLYSTSAVAKIIGIHPNTVRLYESLGLITAPLRKENGYRIFTELHVSQFKLARVAFQIEVLQNGLRKKAVDIVKQSACCDFDGALTLTEDYIIAIEAEIQNACEAVNIVQELLGKTVGRNTSSLTRKEVSDQLNITMDTLRNWEMNGLIKIKRRENGYRVYTDEDILRLKIIRTLKCANYSLSAILRMLNTLDKECYINIGKVLNTPRSDEEIISVCDKLVVSLNNAKSNAFLIKRMLIEMREKYSNPPL